MSEPQDPPTPVEWTEDDLRGADVHPQPPGDDEPEAEADGEAEGT